MQLQGDECLRENWNPRRKASLQGHSIGSDGKSCLGADDVFLSQKWSLWRAAYLTVALLKDVEDLSRDVKSYLAEWMVRLSQEELTVEFPCY